MWNRFKIWINRNDFRIIIYILVIIGIYLMIKGINVFFKNQHDENIKKIAANLESENTSVINENKIDIENLDNINSETEEYQNVNNVAKKIINIAYQVEKSEDNELKEDIINLCSNEFFYNLNTLGIQEITTDNIMEYFVKIDNIDNYLIGKSYKISERNNINKYAVVLRYDDGVGAIIDSYIVFNLDYNNNTFSYDGVYYNLSVINSDINENIIEDNSNNTF